MPKPKYFLPLILINALFFCCTQDQKHPLLPSPQQSALIDSIRQIEDPQISYRFFKSTLSGSANYEDFQRAKNVGLAVYENFENESIDSVMLDLLKGISMTGANTSDFELTNYINGFLNNFCLDNSVDYPKLCADVYFNSSIMHSYYQEWDKAYNKLMLAKSLYQQTYPANHSKHCQLNNLAGKAAIEVRDWDKAESLVKKALECYQQADQPNATRIADITRDLSAIYAATDRGDSAVVLAELALNMFESSGDSCSRNWQMAITSLGIIESSVGYIERSVATYKRLLNVGDCNGATVLPLDRAITYSNIGLAYLTNDRLDEALVNYTKGYEIINSLSDVKEKTPVLISNIFGKAQIFEKRWNQSKLDRDYQLADQEYQLLLQTIVEYRNRFLESEGRIAALNKYETFLAHTAEFYHQKYGNPQDELALKKAWFVFNLSKSMYLFESLATEEMAPEIRNKLAILGQQMANETGAERDQTLREISTLREELFTETGIAVSIPDDYDAFFRKNLLNKTRPNVAQVEYLLGDGSALAIVSSSDGVNFYDLGQDTTLYEEVHDLNVAIRKHDESSTKTLLESSSDLYRKLITPLGLDLTKIESIILIPDGPLRKLPFAVLRSGNNDYFIEETKISYAYSGLLGNRDVSSGESSNPFVGYAPDFKKSLNDEYATTYNSESRSRLDGFAPLRYNDEEIEEIAGIVGGKVFIGKEATANNFFNYFINAEIVHLATHAGIDEQGEPFLILSNPESSTYQLIGQHEVATQKSTARMVVLSACRSADGRISASEGIRSLEKAFFSSGANTVLSTQWEVDDKASQLFMNAFYTSLKKGSSKSAALKDGIKALRGNPNYDHPYYWGGYRLLGDDQPLY